MHDGCNEEITKTIGTVRNDLKAKFESFWSVEFSIETGLFKGGGLGAIEGYVGGVAEIGIGAGLRGAVGVEPWEP